MMTAIGQGETQVSPYHMADARFGDRKWWKADEAVSGGQDYKLCRHNGEEIYAGKLQRADDII